LNPDPDSIAAQTITIHNRCITSDMPILLTDMEIADVEADWRIVSGLV
jgi:hypothetical protein